MFNLESTPGGGTTVAATVSVTSPAQPSESAANDAAPFDLSSPDDSHDPSVDRRRPPCRPGRACRRTRHPNQTGDRRLAGTGSEAIHQVVIDHVTSDQADSGLKVDAAHNAGVG